MTPLLVAGGIMMGVTTFFGLVLATAYRYLRIEEDPRIDAIEEILPGNNCGACGEPGCRAFAEKAAAGEINPGSCTVTGPEGIEAMASLLGVEAEAQDKRVARLHCAGGAGLVKTLGEYQGLRSCRAAVLVNGGEKACAWGCLGLGDCERACDFDAIFMNELSLPVVEVEACTACGDCVDVCPRNLFTLTPRSERLIVQCSSPLTGEPIREICAVSCDACGRCALDAGEGVIEMVDGLPVVRSPAEASAEATFRCPTRAIQWVEGRQLERESTQ